jgi:tRNA (mo5U34)-methyltransferase
MRHDRARLETRIRSLGEWFHNLHLGDVETAPDHPLGDYPRQKWRTFASALPEDLTGRTVLDIGCNAGFYSLEMKRRGAARVVGIDSDARYLAQARFAAEVCGLDLDLRQMSVYDVGALGERFDIVLFLGVLYHLRYPLFALDLIHDTVAGDRLVFQSMLRGSAATGPVAADYPFSERDVFARDDFPALHFIERRYAHDPTNWWVPNRACAAAMLRAAGFAIVDTPEEEVFICRVADRPSIEEI